MRTWRARLRTNDAREYFRLLGNSRDRRYLLMSSSRLSALLLALAACAIALVAAGCGSSSEETTGGSGSSGGGPKLTVGSDIPYPPFEQGKAGEYTGFDVELMEAIAAKIGR